MDLNPNEAGFVDFLALKNCYFFLIFNQRRCLVDIG